MWISTQRRLTSAPGHRAGGDPPGAVQGKPGAQLPPPGDLPPPHVERLTHPTRRVEREPGDVVEHGRYVLAGDDPLEPVPLHHGHVLHQPQQRHRRRLDRRDAHLRVVQPRALQRERRPMKVQPTLEHDPLIPGEHGHGPPVGKTEGVGRGRGGIGGHAGSMPRPTAGSRAAGAARVGAGGTRQRRAAQHPPAPHQHRRRRRAHAQRSRAPALLTPGPLRSRERTRKVHGHPRVRQRRAQRGQTPRTAPESHPARNG